MKSKYELTISTGYVPKWTYIEAIRELFQNAIDNEAVNKENKMSVVYENESLYIANKTSKLTLDSLLLGSSTKRDDDRTIGQHGEGYKIAFMVLLREGKNITVYNYGANEIWSTKIVNSRRYNGAQVIQIEVEKNPIWKKVPDKNLTIEISKITDTEWNEVKEHNLFLRDTLNCTEMTDYGRVLLDEKDKGKVFVKGLYVCNSNNIKYGYDFHTTGIKLDRDRQLVDSFNISWYASAIWSKLSAKPEYVDDITQMVTNEDPDVRYIASLGWSISTVGSKVLQKIKDTYGTNAYPVSDNSRYRAVASAGFKPVIVSEYIERVALRAPEIEEITENDTDIIKMFELFKSKIEHKLDDSELNEFDELLDILREKL